MSFLLWGRILPPNLKPSHFHQLIQSYLLKNPSNSPLLFAFNKKQHELHSKHHLEQSSHPHLQDLKTSRCDYAFDGRVQSSLPTWLASNRNTWCPELCPPRWETCNVHIQSYSQASNKDKKKQVWPTKNGIREGREVRMKPEINMTQIETGNFSKTSPHIKS